MRVHFILSLLYLLAISVTAQNYSWQVDGAPQKLIALDGQSLTRPVYSPDGKTLAFSSDHYQGVYIFNLDQKTWRQLTNDEAAGFAFSWAADSRSILTVSAQFHGLKRLNAVKVFSVSDGKETLLAPYSSAMPANPQWASDQKSVCFMKDGQHLVLSGNGIRQPQQIATMYFLDKGQIYVVDSGQNKKRKLTPLPGKEYINLAVSPANSHLVFEVFGGNLYILNLKTQQLTDLGSGNRPAWSADGSGLCYMKAVDDGHTYTQSEIIVCDASGNNLQQLTETEEALEMNPGWSPDATKIVYSDYRDGAIYILPLIKTGVNE